MSTTTPRARLPVGIITSEQFIADPTRWVEHAIRYGPVLIARPNGTPFATITPSTPPADEPEQHG